MPDEKVEATDGSVYFRLRGTGISGHIGLSKDGKISVIVDQGFESGELSAVTTLLFFEMLAEKLLGQPR